MFSQAYNPRRHRVNTDATPRSFAGDTDTDDDPWDYALNSGRLVHPRAASRPFGIPALDLKAMEQQARKAEQGKAKGAAWATMFTATTVTTGSSDSTGGTSWLLSACTPDEDEAGRAQTIATMSKAYPHNDEYPPHHDAAGHPGATLGYGRSCAGDNWRSCQVGLSICEDEEDRLDEDDFRGVQSFGRYGHAHGQAKVGRDKRPDSPVKAARWACV